jgi:hypothetical protein
MVGDPKIASLVECSDSWHVTDSPWCCYVDDKSCGHDAEFSIINTTPGADPYDYTHACVDHVGALLESLDSVEATEWRVLASIV